MVLASKPTADVQINITAPDMVTVSHKTTHLYLIELECGADGNSDSGE